MNLCLVANQNRKLRLKIRVFVRVLFHAIVIEITLKDSSYITNLSLCSGANLRYYTYEKLLAKNKLMKLNNKATIIV